MAQLPLDPRLPTFSESVQGLQVRSTLRSFPIPALQEVLVLRTYYNGLMERRAWTGLW